MDKRHNSRLAIYVLLQKDQKTLFLRRSNTGYRDGMYTLPAGHVEPGETLLETCVREVNEEVCLSIHPDDLKLIHVMQRFEGSPYVDFYFQASEWYGEPAIGEPNKADDLMWLNSKETKDVIPFVNDALINISNEKIFSHDGVLSL